MKKLRKFSPQARTALALSAVGLLIVGSGTAFSRGSAVPGSGGVKAEDIAAQAVHAKKIRDYNIGPMKLSYTPTRSASETVEAGTSEAVTAGCEPNERMLSGGFAVGADHDVQVIRSRPTDSGPGGWEVFAHNYSGANTELTAYAICLQ